MMTTVYRGASWRLVWPQPDRKRVWASLPGKLPLFKLGNWSFFFLCFSINSSISFFVKFLLSSNSFANQELPTLPWHSRISRAFSCPCFLVSSYPSSSWISLSFTSGKSRRLDRRLTAFYSFFLGFGWWTSGGWMFITFWCSFWVLMVFWKYMRTLGWKRKLFWDKTLDDWDFLNEPFLGGGGGEVRVEGEVMGL